MIMDACQRFDPELPEGTRSISRTDISGVNQHPSCLINLLLALQHVFVQCSLLVLVLGVLQQHLLLQDGERARLLSSMLFYSSLSSLIQSCLGTCLPLIQAPSLEILIPAVVLTAQIVTEPACRGPCGESEEEILPRANPVRELQGMTVMVGMVQLVLGVTGLSGVVLRHCGPLVIAPLLCLLGFSIYREAALLCSDHWAIAALTVILLVFLSQHLHSYMLPACLSMPQLPVCRMLSVLLPLLSVWALCAVLESFGGVHLHSVSELLPVLKTSNTSLSVPSSSDHTSFTVPWLSPPMAAETGLPLLSVRGMAAGVVAALSSSVSSVGMYLLTARLLGAPPPPAAACNRGLGAQGLGSVVAGLMGAPLGLSCSVPNACTLGLSQSGSRWTVQLTAILGLALGVSPRLTQLITSVPLAIYGAILSVTYTIAVATGVRYFQFTHIDSGRMVSVDVLLQSLLTSPVLLVGILAFLLDNTVSGSPSERGLDSAEMQKRGCASVNSDPGHHQEVSPGSITRKYHQEVALVYESPYLLRRLWRLPGFRAAPFSACRIEDDGDIL
ncbi:hypothetical protein J4Q44_G00193940 [Coregonus suidteri]|uniref:Solute carrier family 23 member 3 n=1 Tax=Coregonus suidteri TaxID=861788 RepID=A0AAN8QSL6_9TELE